MRESRERRRVFFPALVILALVLCPILAAPASAIDVFSRSSEVDLLLREVGRLKGLQVTVDIRFLTVDDRFLEQVGVDFSGSVNGEVRRGGQPVQGAKLILEAYRVQNGGESGFIVSKTGRTVVSTDAAGQFQVKLKALIDADSRAAVLAGEVAALRIEATGRNGKRVDHVHLRGTTALGGLLE